MACVPSAAGPSRGGDVELLEISLASSRERHVPGDARASSSETDEEDADEEKGPLLGGEAGSSSRASGGGAPGGDAPRASSRGAEGRGARWPTGEAAMVAATFVLAFQNIVAKTVERRVPPLQVVFVRSVASGCVTLATIHHRNVAASRRAASSAAAGGDAPWDPPSSRAEALFGPREMWPLCFVRGAAGSVAFSLAYVSLTYLTVADSVAIFFLNPIFSSLLAWPVLGEPVGVVEAAAIALGLLGTTLIVKPPALSRALERVFAAGAPDESAPSSSSSSSPAVSPVGVVITLISAVHCAVAMVTIRKIGPRVPALKLALWFHASSAAVGFASCAARWPAAPETRVAARDWGALALISVTSFFGQLGLNHAYGTLPTLTASALYYLMVVWSALLGVACMGEGMDAAGAAGAAVIAVGGLMPSANKARRERAAKRGAPPPRAEVDERRGEADGKEGGG